MIVRLFGSFAFLRAILLIVLTPLSNMHAIISMNIPFKAQRMSWAKLFATVSYGLIFVNTKSVPNNVFRSTMPMMPSV